MTTSVGQSTFVGDSGARYIFEIYTLDTNFRDDFAAVYIFSRQTAVLSHIPIYIGETDELGTCIRNHEKWPCVRRNGVTHICIFGEHRRRARKKMAQDLIEHYDPTCNLG